MNSKSIRENSFMVVLMLMLLFSSTVGTIVAVKPEKPGKPVETWDLKIWVGVMGEDIVLTSPVHVGGEPYGDIYLEAEAVPCSGGLWDIPKGKGFKGSVSAQVDLYRWFESGEWIGDPTCGTYYLNTVEGVNSDGVTTYLDEFHHDSEYYTITGFIVGHLIDRLGQDYWWFWLQWVEGPPFDENSNWYHLYAWTNMDANEEGMHPENEPDVWLVEFYEADPNQPNAMIFKNYLDDVDADGMPDTFYWLGTVGFSVAIAREPHLA